MKKIYLQLFIVIVGVILCIVGHNAVKEYMVNNYVKKTTKVLAYNNFSNVSFEPRVITTQSTTTTTLKTTTTKISTTTYIRTVPIITTTTKVLEPFKDAVINETLSSGDNEINELTIKLNKSLSSTLTNTGHFFANYYAKTGMDPYLAVAIVLHETGCKWTCSKLVRECNNIGGIKGKPSCNGGSYKKFDSLESGINGYLDMLYNNYYSKGLTTPEQINPKYAASTVWSEKINKYMEEIKAKV